MIKQVEKYILSNDMFRVGDGIIVGVSGGPDSMCLLDILVKIQKRYKLKIVAAHINHGVRGEESDKDQEYVREYCEENKIPFEFIKIDMEAIAKERKISSEMAGREVRYSFFDELRVKYSAGKVAVAHNCNDIAETVLMRIFRGTGTDGLEGIKPVRDGYVIRPILCLNREVIERYCRDNGLNPRIDKTNLENVYNRNKIRLDIIPYIKDNFNEDVINTFARLSKNIARDNEYFHMETKKVFEEFCVKNATEVKVKKALFTKHEAIVTRCIRMCINEVKGDMKNIDQIHVYDILGLSEKESGKRIDIPGEIVVINSFGDLIITKDKVEESKKGKTVLKINREVQGYEIKVIKKEKSNIKYNSTYTKYFDYDKIKGNICLRTREDGDAIIPFGMTGRKKIKKIFSENKIPPHMRDSVPIIQCDDGIMWIVGCVISNKFKVDKNTENVMVIKFKGEKKYD